MLLSKRIDTVLKKHGVVDVSGELSRDLADAVSRHRSLGYKGTSRKQRRANAIPSKEAAARLNEEGDSNA